MLLSNVRLCYFMFLFGVVLLSSCEEKTEISDLNQLTAIANLQLNEQEPGDLIELEDRPEIASEYSRNPPFVLYMSPVGSDNNSGLSPASPLKTINKVQARLQQLKPTIDTDIEIRIKYIPNKPYLNQTVIWRHTSNQYNISFMPQDYQYGGGYSSIAGRPEFDGNGTNNWFFDLREFDGRSNIRFYYLKVSNYAYGGIRFYGDRTNPPLYDGWNSHNSVFGCYFYELGNKKYPGLNLGYAAIDFVNSDHNTITNNHFVKLENKTADASHIHGVYLAHNSCDNLIRRNKFYKITGDAVRIRNYSNRNDIQYNRIIRSGIRAHYSTYRNSEIGECRSWENRFRYNTVSCGYNGKKISLFRYYLRYNGNGATPDGPQYPDGNCPSFSRRLYTVGNVRDCN